MTVHPGSGSSTEMFALLTSSLTIVKIHALILDAILTSTVNTLAQRGI